MKRMIRTSEDINASEFDKSSKSEVLSIAEALKYVLDDLSDSDYKSMTQDCPDFYNNLSDFIKSN